jgi:RNA polymerase sigma-70 factor, ECF subfamily
MSYSVSMSIERRNRVVKQALELRPMLVGYAYGLLRHHARAEDAVHEAYLVVMDKYEQFEEGTSLIAWCRTILRYKVAEMVRKERRLVPVEQRILDDAVESAFQLTQQDTQSRRYDALAEALEHCVSQLTEEQRALLSACYSERLSYEESAGRFGLRVETVRKRLYRIRAGLRDCAMKRKALMEAQP